MTPEQIKQLAKQAGGMRSVRQDYSNSGGYMSPTVVATTVFTETELAEFVRLVREVPAGMQPVPEINFFDAQRIANEYGLVYNRFCAAHKAMLEAAKQ